MVVVKPPELDRIAIEPFFERVARAVAAQRAADAHLIPRIGHAQAVAAEDVDAARLRHGADLARVVHAHLLGRNEDLGELGIDADQLDHAVVGRRRRQVDDAAIEAVPVLQPLAHVVVDRDVAGRRFQHLAAAAGRGAEHHVAAAPGMADGRDLARLAAQDVEHAHAVFAGRDLGQRFDAGEVLEGADAGAEGGHLYLSSKTVHAIKATGATVRSRSVSGHCWPLAHRPQRRRAAPEATHPRAADDSLRRPGGASHSSPGGRFEPALGDHRHRRRRREVVDQLLGRLGRARRR